MRKLLLLICVAALGALGAAAATSYNINVGGVEVKSDNASNVTGGDIKAYDTSQSYSVTYSSSTNTLTLTNVKIGRSGSGDFCVHNRGCANLKIVFNGTCMLSSARAEAIKCEKFTTITVNGKVDCSGFGDRGIFLKSASLVLNGTGTLNVYGSGSGINGDSGNETVTTSLNKLTVNSANNAALKKLATFTVNPRNTSLVISTQVILQDPEESTQSSSAKYTESVTAVNFGSGVSVTKPMGATYNSTSGFTRPGEVLKPSTHGGLVISDERDNPAYTTVGDFQYSVSGGLATLQGPTMAYRKTRPTSVVIPGYVTISGTLMPVKIAAQAFADKMPDVTRVDMRYGVQEIGVQAFYYCSALTRITIPSSVKTIGSYMIIGTKVSEVYWATLSPTSVSTNAYSFNTGNSLSRKMYFPTLAAKNAAPSSTTSGYTTDVYPNSACDFSNNGTYYVVTKAGSNNGNDGEVAVVGGDPNSISSWSDYTTSQTGNGARYYPTSIAPYAFYNKTGITTATLSPSMIKTVGESAFSGCTGLQTVTIGTGVTSIADNAFSGCTGVRTVNWNAANYTYSGYTGMLRSMFNSDITTVNIGSTATSIPKYMCNGLTKITSVTIPSPATTIGDAAFYGCTGITRLSLPETLISIRGYAFMGCTGLTSVNIPNSVISIGQHAFSGCSAVTAVTIGSALITIGSGGFDGCTAVRTVNWNSANYTIELGSLFNTDINTVTFGAALTSIPSGLCMGLTRLTSITIPDAVTNIGTSAFEGCTGLTSVTIPNSVNTIRQKAFSGCAKLYSVTLGTGITSIAGDAFSSSGTNDVTWNIPDYKYSGTTGLLITLFNYGIRKVTIGPAVTKVPQYFCANLSNLNSLSIGNAVNSIGAYAFYDCNKLSSINIPNSVKAIGENAFDRCNHLTIVTISDLEKWCAIDFSGFTSNPLYMAHHLYLNGTELTDLDIPDSMTSIGRYAFCGGSALTSVTLPNSVAEIGFGAFDDCSNLTRVSISDLGKWCAIDFSWFTSNPLYMAHHLYLNDTELTNLDIPDSVTSICPFAFYGGSALTSVTLPNSVEEIGLNAFAYCTGLQHFYTLPRCADIAMGDNVFLHASTGACTLHVKQGQLEAYKAANQWKDFYNIVGDQEDPDYNPNKFDVNNDGDVNVGDVNAVLEAILNNWVDDKFDVNGDDEVTVGDVNAILEYILAH